MTSTALCDRCGLDFDPVYADAVCPLCGAAAPEVRETDDLPLAVRLTRWVGVGGRAQWAGIAIFGALGIIMFTFAAAAYYRQ